MPFNNWDDQKVEEILKQFPTFEDYRGKLKILEILEQNERVNKNNQEDIVN